MAIVFLAAAALLATLLPAHAAEPPQPTTATDPDHCKWEWQAHGGIGVWTERCELQTGVWSVVFKDADPPRYELTIDGESSGAVLQSFAKPDAGDASTILLELRLRGLIPDDDECAFEPATEAVMSAFGPTPKARAYFEIVPTGKRKAAYDATPADEVPEPQCGEYGSGPEGVRVFMTDARFPDRVIYMNLGQDGTMFDPKTVTLE